MPIHALRCLSKLGINVCNFFVKCFAVSRVRGRHRAFLGNWIPGFNYIETAAETISGATFCFINCLDIELVSLTSSQMKLKQSYGLLQSVSLHQLPRFPPNFRERNLANLLTVFRHP